MRVVEKWDFEASEELKSHFNGGKMYYYLINNRRPIKSKQPIRNKNLAQGFVKNVIVQDMKVISFFSYWYNFIKYEIYG